MTVIASSNLQPVAPSSSSSSSIFRRSLNTDAKGTTDAVAAAATASATEKPHPDGMDRYPHLRDVRGFLRLSDYIGTLAFASSGSILAASHGMDLLGAVALGTITAVGGGTVRDVVVLGRIPFWSGDEGETEYLWLAFAAAVGAFFMYPILPGVFDSEGAEFLDAWGMSNIHSTPLTLLQFTSLHSTSLHFTPLHFTFF